MVEGGGSETAMARALLGESESLILNYLAQMLSERTNPRNVSLFAMSEKELVGIQKVLSVYWNTLESIFRYYRCVC